MDGGDSQVFAPGLDYVNHVQGPLRVRGGLGDDRTGLFEREPIMLPKGHNGLPEFNRKQEMGRGQRDQATRWRAVAVRSPSTAAISTQPSCSG